MDIFWVIGFQNFSSKSYKNDKGILNKNGEKSQNVHTF